MFLSTGTLLVFLNPLILKPKYEFYDALNRGELARKEVKHKVYDLPEEKSFESAPAKKNNKYEIVILKGADNKFNLVYKANLTGESIFDSFYGYISCESGEMIFHSVIGK